MPQIKKITDLTAPELDLFSRYSESQLFHINEPQPRQAIFILFPRCDAKLTLRFRLQEYAASALDKFYRGWRA